MRKIRANRIRDAVGRLCIEANVALRSDILGALERSVKSEKNKRGRSILRHIVKNARIAKAEKMPICQDTGMTVVYCRVGQGVSITAGSFHKAVNDGVKDGYRKGRLRKSVVRCPIARGNTRTNAPAVIHTTIVPGDKLSITVCPKGFGSENKSRIKMFNPTASEREIKDFIIDTARAAGAAACPPFVLGIGIGGTFEKSAELAKSALLVPIDRKNPKKKMKKLETELLREINKLNIGPMGLGGKTTALGVNILDFPTHIAGLPVAVCVSCHATRSAGAIL